MKMTWFQHPVCTTEVADELVKQYRRRGVKTERSLNHDCIHWTVSALLPEFDHVPERRRKCSYLK
ncbi:hypothetical protein VQY73_002344 [Salmonella enterica]|uniref:hypothetical protein n=1 Tax=Salmonella enterica TaxID=28901 RepID=UPI001013988D|nr:hypothetical protein [Salmonella enterica]EBE9589098.1 hypothetical protein [Salmonella enterica subsp. enterica serovar Infantis]EBG5302041.1 hypothetical protein [Salmonella enterica subsp. enterica serovar Oranienburg]EBV4371355.1 hypothetical protein [Salmonella enterica subsp. enterica serovar Matadi]EBY0267136.1 hypothetical protein [Salmonella enterica subsp. enterica serovar Rubislaw]EBY6678788.1 hypothetical protein [Salmonella enterica subsp. enterica serovar Saphra]EDE4783379.1 